MTFKILESVLYYAEDNEHYAITETRATSLSTKKPSRTEARTSNLSITDLL